jgi:hypothetical protein
MQTVATILRMVVRRSLANRRLLATVIVGVVMSAALMSSVILYSDAIRDLGLSHALKNADPISRNVRVVVSGRPDCRTTPPGAKPPTSDSPSTPPRLSRNWCTTAGQPRSTRRSLARSSFPVGGPSRAHLQFVDTETEVELVEAASRTRPSEARRR